MARLFTSSFGLDSVTDGVEFTTNSAPVAISTSTTRPGSDGFSGQVQNGVGFFRQQVATSNQTTIGYTSFAVNIAAYPNNTTQLVRFGTSTNSTSGIIFLQTNGALFLANSATTQIGSVSSILSLNTWYIVELKCDATTNPGALEGRLNGTVFASGSNNGQGSWSKVLIGNITSAQTSNNLFFDDWKINDNSGTVQNSYPGSGNVLTIHPNGAGDSASWTKGGSSTAATNYQGVNEVPPDDAVTFNSSNTLNQQDMFTVQSTGLPSYDTVNVVQVGIRHANGTADATTSFKVQVEKATGGTKQQSAAIIPNSVTWTTNSTQAARADTYKLTAYTDPDGVPWVPGGTLDTMQIGYIQSAAGTNAVEITNVWAVIDYTPGSPAAPSNGSFLLKMI